MRLAVSVKRDASRFQRQQCVSSLTPSAILMLILAIVRLDQDANPRLRIASTGRGAWRAYDDW